ncbi:MAG: hypothetical protein ACI9X0_000687 [Kiritimatiellia bacterium]|jgi:hypothetical protein
MNDENILRLNMLNLNGKALFLRAALVGVLLLFTANRAIAETHTLAQVVSNLFIGDIDVSGTLVDTNGFAIDGNVSVEIWGEDGNPLDAEVSLLEYEQSLTNGLFSVTYSNCHSAMLEFTSSNRYSSTRYYAINGEVLITNGSVRTLVVTNENVVLWPIPQVSSMVTHDVVIWSTSTGQSSVVDVSAIGDGEAVHYVVEPENEIPAATIYLSAATNSYGDYFMDAAGLPSNVQLRVMDDYGLQAVPLVSAPSNEIITYSQFRHMQTAPVDGYTNAFSFGQGDDYFYLRVANRYGKGSVSTPIMVGSNRVECRIVLHVATNGLRAVGTSEVW